MRYISLDLHPITIAALNPSTDDRQPDGWHSREAAQAQRDDRPFWANGQRPANRHPVWRTVKSGGAPEISCRLICSA